jgi:3',5'-cyclic AMP phosphodiesterase CpdA
MKSRFIRPFVLVLILLFTGCDYFDFWGAIASSPVDERFKEKDRLKGFDPPASIDPDNFNFMVITDLHYYNTQLDIIKNINANRASWNLSFIVVDGDIVQDGLKKNYDLATEDFATTALPIYTVIGNHDLYNNGFEIYKKVFGRTVYDIKIGRILHMVFLDTANGTIGELQKNWLDDVIRKSDSKYKIVFTHYSPTDNSVWQSLTTMSYPDDSYYLYDLFDTYNVDFCVAGHLHTYDRKEIRGVKYIIIDDISGNNGTHLLFSVKNGNLDFSSF